MTFDDWLEEPYVRHYAEQDAFFGWMEKHEEEVAAVVLKEAVEDDPEECGGLTVQGILHDKKWQATISSRGEDIYDAECRARESERWTATKP